VRSSHESKLFFNFVNNNSDTIQQRKKRSIEEFDTMLTIHMDTDAVLTGEAYSLLGFSTGYWENQTLVVRTDNVDSPYFDSNGTPQGRDPGFVERFRVSDDGSRLLYELTATDEEVFTEPVTVTRDWFWRPGEEVKPYDCDDTE
jgi:hypothetical protein